MILKPRELEKLEHTDDDGRWKTILEQSSIWEYSRLTPEKQATEERFLVKYHRIFVRHQLDIGNSNEFKIKLTPTQDEAVYAQNLTTPTNLKDEMLVKLAIQQEYIFLKNLHFFAKTHVPILDNKTRTDK